MVSLCLLLVHKISITMVCVSQEELSITESNQYTHWLLLVSHFKDFVNLCKINFLYQ